MEERLRLPLPSEGSPPAGLKDRHFWLTGTLPLVLICDGWHNTLRPRVCCVSKCFSQAVQGLPWKLRGRSLVSPLASLNSSEKRFLPCVSLPVTLSALRCSTTSM